VRVHATIFQLPRTKGTREGGREEGYTHALVVMRTQRLYFNPAINFLIRQFSTTEPQERREGGGEGGREGGREEG